MEIILARSPYFITIDELDQQSTKVELFIWHKGETEPSTPTYTLSKSAPSPTQRANTYNIAPYIKENITVIAPTTTELAVEENVNQWCYCKVKRYSIESDVATLLDTVTYIGLNGYTNYMDGYNYTYSENNIVLTNHKIQRYYFLKTGYSDGSYFNYLMQETSPSDEIELRYYDNLGVLVDTVKLNSNDDYLYKIPHTLNQAGLVNGGWVTIYNFTQSLAIQTIASTPLCEIKYSPVICSFVNLYGGWQFITFFKAKSENYESKSKDFSSLPTAVDYNPLTGQSQSFNFEAKKTIKLNTGWIDENYSIAIEQLFNSETILLDEVPVKLKSSNFQIKTQLKDRNINYEIEFEYNFNQINNVQ